MVIPFVILIAIIAIIALRASNRRPEDLKGPAATLLSFFVLMGGFFFFFGLEHGWENALPWTMALAVSIAAIFVVAPSIRQARGARVRMTSATFLYLFASVCAMYAVMVFADHERRLSLFVPGATAMGTLVAYAFALASPHQRAQRRLRNTPELPVGEWKDGTKVKVVGTVRGNSAEPLIEGDEACVLWRVKGVASVQYTAAQLKKARRSVLVRIPGAGQRASARVVHPNQLQKYGITSALVGDEVDFTQARDFIVDIGAERVRVDGTRVSAHLAHDEVTIAAPTDACEQTIFAHVKAKLDDADLRSLRVQKQVLRIGERVTVVGIVRSELRRDDELAYRGTPNSRSFVLASDETSPLLITNAEPLPTED